MSPNEGTQSAKKVVFDSQGLEDFAIGLVKDRKTLILIMNHNYAFTLLNCISIQ